MSAYSVVAATIYSWRPSVLPTACGHTILWYPYPANVEDMVSF